MVILKMLKERKLNKMITWTYYTLFSIRTAETYIDPDTIKKSTLILLFGFFPVYYHSKTD